MPQRWATAFEVDKQTREVQRQFKVAMPTLLYIDPRGHFTRFRCAAVVALDRLGLKFKFLIPRIANLCEFLANYPCI